MESENTNNLVFTFRVILIFLIPVLFLFGMRWNTMRSDLADDPGILVSDRISSCKAKGGDYYLRHSSVYDKVFSHKYVEYCSTK